MGGLKSIGKRLEKLGKKIIENGLPLVGEAVIRGHSGVIGDVFEVLDLRGDESEEQIIQKLTPDSLADIKNRELELKFKLAELEVEKERIEQEKFEQGQNTIQSMIMSNDWYTRNAIPTICWVFAAGWAYSLILSPFLHFIIVILTAMFDLPELQSITLPVISIPEWYGDMVCALFGIAMAKKGVENSSFKLGSFEKLKRD